MQSGTDSTQLGLEGTDLFAVAIPKALNADGNPGLLLSRQDSEGAGAEHKALALEASEVGTTPRVIDVKEHHAGVRRPGVVDQVGHSPLVEVNGTLPLAHLEYVLDGEWSNGDGLARFIEFNFLAKEGEIGDPEEGLR